ncbi:MAG TPA: MFS transporter [Planctomycetota bacterium]|nr:MFS transporter [Planctomycetota bacterium]
MSEQENSKGKWMALLAAFLGWMFDGLEIGLFPLAGRPAMQELLHATGPQADQLIGQWMSGIVASFLLGAALGGTVFGWLGDRIGRVRAMIFSVLAYSLFSGACVFVQSPFQLAALRFIASMGMGGEWALGVSLVSEIWPARSRPLLSGLIGAAANVGFMIVGFVGLGVSKFITGLGSLLSFLPHSWVDALLRHDGWRMIFLVGAIPALLTFFIRMFVPESEKWKSATTSGPKPRVADIFAPGLARNTILGACLAGIALLGTWGAVQFLPAWASKFTNDPLKAAWTQIFSAVGACTIPVVVALLAQQFSRRTAYIGLCVLSLLSCEALYLLFRTEPHFGFLFLLLATLVNGITAGFYGWLPLYLPELFPTRVRATGAGFTFNAGRVIAATGTFLASGNLLKLFGSYATMGSIMCLVYLLGLVVIFFCPETTGKPLPE